jgi:hypothetical protein
LLQCYCLKSARCAKKVDFSIPDFPNASNDRFEPRHGQPGRLGNALNSEAIIVADLSLLSNQDKEIPDYQLSLLACRSALYRGML